MPLIITALTASSMAMLLVFLALITIRMRMKFGAAFGDGGQHGLTSAIRAHANLAEYMPIGITLIALIEAGPHNPLILEIAAATFVVSRALNAIGLFNPPGPPTLSRSIGIVATLLVLLGLAAWLGGRTIGLL